VKKAVEDLLWNLMEKTIAITMFFCVAIVFLLQFAEISLIPGDV